MRNAYNSYVHEVLKISWYNRENKAGSYKLEFGSFWKKIRKQIKVDFGPKKRENTKEKIMNRVDKRVFFFLPLKEEEKLEGKKERTKRN